MNEDGPPDINERAVARRVQEALTDMHYVRQEFLRARQMGMLSQRQKLKMQSRILDVIEVLRPFRNRVEEDWQSATEFEDKGLDDLPSILAPVSKERVVEKGFGRETIEVVEEPQTLAPRHILSISHELDDIAKDIGFEPAPPKDLGDVDGGIV